MLRRDLLDIIDDGPLDTFFTRRLGYGTLVAPIRTEIDSLQELHDQDLPSCLVTFLVHELEDRSKKGVIIIDSLRGVEEDGNDGSEV